MINERKKTAVGTYRRISVIKNNENIFTLALYLPTQLWYLFTTVK